MPRPVKTVGFGITARKRVEYTNPLSSEDKEQFHREMSGVDGSALGMAKRAIAIAEEYLPEGQRPADLNAWLTRAEELSADHGHVLAYRLTEEERGPSPKPHPVEQSEEWYAWKVLEEAENLKAALARDDARGAARAAFFLAGHIFEAVFKTRFEPSALIPACVASDSRGGFPRG